MKTENATSHELVMELAQEHPETLVPPAGSRSAEGEFAYRYLHDIIEFLPDPTLVVDRNNKVIFWNRAMEELTGVAKEEMIGNGDFIYALPFYGERRQMLIDLVDDVDSAIEKYGYIKKEGRTLTAEAHIKDLNGRERYLWATATLLCDSNGNKAGAIESIRDITEYKLYEEQKGKLEAQLHHSRMMEKFLVQLGHDLNTPLTPLFVMLPMIKDRIDDPSLVRMVDICLRSAENIHSLTKKGLKLARLSSASCGTLRETIDLSVAVNTFIASFSNDLQDKKISCTNAVTAGTAVRVSPDQLKELFSNLLSNAVSYTPEGGSISISAEVQTEKSVKVSVADDGWGIMPEHLEHIFDEFFKSDESRHDLNKSGLGLAICRKIVSNHEGTIWAESAGRNLGTTISFTLPRP